MNAASFAAGLHAAPTGPFAIVDGGLSTALERRGHHPGGPLWTAQLVIDRPGEIVAAHSDFVEAGADIVISASYQASIEGFVAAGLSSTSAVAALASTTELARRSGARWVAASIGPFGASLADGSEYHGRYAASWAEVRAFHRRRIATLAPTGPDLWAIETIPSRAEAEIVLEEVAAFDTAAWLAVSCTDGTHTCGGDDIVGVASMATQCPQLVGFGVNCTSPQYVAELLRQAASATTLPLVAYSNHGRRWDAAAKCWTGHQGDAPAAHAARWYELGARLIGGCCGTDADDIAALAEVRRCWQ
jgi:homocysteine S-methyltransferase